MKSAKVTTKAAKSVKPMTAGKAKGSGKPRPAPKVAPPNPINGNYMKEAGQAGTKGRLMTKKRLSK